MSDPNLIKLRSDKTSFLIFEEMDLNLLQLKELITEFNTFVDVNFANHVADFNQLALDFSNYQIEVENEFLTSVGGSAIIQDATTSTPLYPVFVDTTSGTAKEINVDDTKLTYTPATSALKTGWFITPRVVSESITIGAGMTTVTGDREIAIGTTVIIEPGGQWKIA